MIMVTGASGQLGSLTLDELIARRVPAVGASRTSRRGWRHVDFDDMSSLDLTGNSTLLLVSAGYAEDDQVIDRHRRVVGAAKRDGVAHIVYTSLTAVGDHLGFALEQRPVRRAGRRADLASVPAIVATAPDQHAGKTYDLVGDPLKADDVAARLGVAQRAIDLDAYRAGLLADGDLLPFQPPKLASVATSIRHGFLDNSSPDLVELLDRPATDPLTRRAGPALSEGCCRG